MPVPRSARDAVASQRLAERVEYGAAWARFHVIQPLNRAWMRIRAASIPTSGPRCPNKMAGIHKNITLRARKITIDSQCIGKNFRGIPNADATMSPMRSL